MSLQGQSCHLETLIKVYFYVMLLRFSDFSDFYWVLRLLLTQMHCKTLGRLNRKGRSASFSKGVHTVFVCSLWKPEKGHFSNDMYIKLLLSMVASMCSNNNDPRVINLQIFPPLENTRIRLLSGVINGSMYQVLTAFNIVGNRTICQSCLALLLLKFWGKFLCALSTTERVWFLESAIFREAEKKVWTTNERNKKVHSKDLRKVNEVLKV